MQVSDRAEMAMLIYWVGHRFDSWGILVWFLAGEEFFLYSKMPMPVLVPTQPPVQWAWGGLAWSRPFMSIYCSAEVECVCVCVELNLHSPEGLHGMHRNKLHWKHWIRFLSEEWLLHPYCWVQFAPAILGHKWLFFLPWIVCCIFLRVCMNPQYSI